MLRLTLYSEYNHSFTEGAIFFDNFGMILFAIRWSSFLLLRMWEGLQRAFDFTTNSPGSVSERSDIKKGLL